MPHEIDEYKDSSKDPVHNAKIHDFVTQMPSGEMKEQLRLFLQKQANEPQLSNSHSTQSPQMAALAGSAQETKASQKKKEKPSSPPTIPKKLSWSEYVLLWLLNLSSNFIWLRLFSLSTKGKEILDFDLERKTLALRKIVQDIVILREDKKTNFKDKELKTLKKEFLTQYNEQKASLNFVIQQGRIHSDSNKDSLRRGRQIQSHIAKSIKAYPDLKSIFGREDGKTELAQRVDIREYDLSEEEETAKKAHQPHKQAQVRGDDMREPLAINNMIKHTTYEGIVPKFTVPDVLESKPEYRLALCSKKPEDDEVEEEGEGILFLYVNESDKLEYVLGGSKPSPTSRYQIPSKLLSEFNASLIKKLKEGETFDPREREMISNITREKHGYPLCVDATKDITSYLSINVTVAVDPSKHFDDMEGELKKRREPFKSSFKPSNHNQGNEEKNSLSVRI